MLIWGEDENSGHSPSWSLFHPLCQMYWYHWQQSRAWCYHHHHACTCVVFLGLKASPLSLLIIKLSLSMWAAANFNWAWKCRFWRGFLTWSEPFSPRGCKTHFTGQWHFVLAVSTSWQTWALGVPGLFPNILKSFLSSECDSLLLLPDPRKVLIQLVCTYSSLNWQYICSSKNCTYCCLELFQSNRSNLCKFSFLDLHWTPRLSHCLEYWSIQWVLSNKFFLCWQRQTVVVNYDH